MLLTQVDVLKSVAYEPNPDGRYWWTSVYYYDQNEFSSLGSLVARVKTVDRFISHPSVRYERFTVKQPPGRENVVTVITDGLTFGLLPELGGPYSLINIIRVTTYFDDGRGSYRLLRSPLEDAAWTGNMLASLTISQAGGYINAQRAISGFPPSRNQYGGELISAIVSPFVRQWQLRHGTKRRERDYS